MLTDETALSTEHTEKRRALLELVTRRRNRYLSFLRARLRDPELAEDILQQVTVKILERSSQLQSAARAEAWLFRVLRNAVADQFRSNSTGGLAVDTDAAHLAAAAASHLPVLCPCATSQLDHLKPEYEEALREVTMTGAPVASYAASRGISSNAAMVRLHRARKSLRGRLMKVCGRCAGSGCFDCSC
jgi:DNA-directed RNA polymerase specialized sigma24 family protein